MSQLSLIDGDIVTYRCGAAADGRHYIVTVEGTDQVLEKFKYKKEADAYIAGNPDLVATLASDPEPLGNALHSVKLLLTHILEASHARDYKVYLSPEGGNTFRHTVYPEYKANRKDMVKPHWYKEIRQYLVDKWEAEVCVGIEADDAMGIAQCSNDKSVICSIDKDLLMIPGNHYNFVTEEHTYTSEKDGWFNFHRQVITGDRTDNVPGLGGYGPIKAAAVLDCPQEDWPRVTAELYQKVYPDSWEDQINLTAQLIWIQREHGKNLRLEYQEAAGSSAYSWRTVDLT